ncbi:hypothetical protein HER32_11515 [Hymenobacter sp. BT18]|uniref:DUF922 domain-containing protein n=1 Tax=Hymenobacter sp. BT18 TaxID=2835648 RepID=UPI00143E8A0F|nr:hypothetical protein [Hymenobacter sp. BT18]QIX61772.1 hypothetical protein HER32_11515 [Hymenobacter sp. BT18]
MMPLRTWIGLSLALAGCAPQVAVQRPEPLPASCPAPAQTVLVLAASEPVEASARELACIQVRPSLLSFGTDSVALLQLATTQARQLGANLLRLEKPTSPTAGLQARAFQTTSLRPYEQEILWHPARRLTPADFKGRARGGRCEAATHSGIRYRCRSQPWQRTTRLTIEAYFDCRHSSFHPSRTPGQTLAHEQLHFDITELYARHLAQRLQAEATTTPELTRRHRRIFRQLMAEANARQDQFDREVYANRTRLLFWRRQVARELQVLQPYANKQLTLQVRDAHEQLSAYVRGRAH